MKAIAFTATFWDCPGCKTRVFLRDVVLVFDEVVHVGPAQPFECSACGYCLSEKDLRPTRGGRILRGGWWFVCLSCLRDTFVAETVYGTNCVGTRTERPPSTAKCMSCGEEHEITLPDED